MSLQRQSVNLVLYQGIDTKTNSKLVEGKLLEMENCEIQNQEVIKSPGNISLADDQTITSDPLDQKGITTAYNTLLVADDNALYKYNSDQDVLNQIDNISFCKTNEFNISQNISEEYYVYAGGPPNDKIINQLYAPFSLLYTPYPDGTLIPEPISCQFGIYLFTVIFRVTDENLTAPRANQYSGYFEISLYNTDTNTRIYESTFSSGTEVPQDAVGTPAGIFFYTVDASNGHINEYFMTYDLSIVHMTPPTALTNIFPANPVLYPLRTTITNLTNYVNVISVEYTRNTIFIAFRQDNGPHPVGGYNFKGMLGSRSLVGTTILSPFQYMTGTIDSNFTNQNLCTTIFYHPVVDTVYLAMLFANEYIVLEVNKYVVCAQWTSATALGFPTHSLGFLTKTTELVALIHDIKEFTDSSPTVNTIAPTVNKFKLTQTTGIQLSVTQTLTGTGSDPRRNAFCFGTSAIAGRVLCVYDKIFIPIFYFAYISEFEAPAIGKGTLVADLRNSVHMVQFIEDVAYPSPIHGLTKILNHVTWVKDYSCSLYTYANTFSGKAVGRAVIPSIMKSKITFEDDENQTNNYFIGFYVKYRQLSDKGNVFFKHNFNSYKIEVPKVFDFQGFPRSSFYFGFNKLNEITQNTETEMNFFDFPQVGLSVFVIPTPPPKFSGAYLYNVHYEWTNGNGEVVRSAIAELFISETEVNTIGIFVTPPPFFSNKQGIVTRIFRSTSNASVPFFNIDLPVSANLPSYSDNKADADIENNPIVYTYGGILEDIPFPAIGTFTLYKNAIIAIDANNPNKILFSKAYSPGLALASAFPFFFNVDSKDGPVTFIQTLDDKLIIFKENSIYFAEGDLPNDAGLNSTLTPPQFIISPVGCNEPNSIVVYPQGIIFKSKKGIWSLDRSLSTKYIGADVEAYNNLTITSAQLLTEQNKVKFTTLEGTVLVYDYYYNAWNIETFEYGLLDTAIVDDALTYITSEGKILQENNDVFLRNQHNYTMKFTTGWIKLGGLIGYQRLYKILFLGDYTGSHIIKASISFDYDENPKEFHYFNPTQNLGVFNSYGNTSQSWGQVTPYAGYADSTYLFRINVQQQKCVSVKITFEDVFDGDINQTGSSFKATALNFDIGVKSQTAKVASRLQT